MELTLATKKAKSKAKTGNALAGALLQLLFLIAIAYLTAYLVSGCINLAPEPANQEPVSGAIQRSDSPLHAELLCGSSSPRFGERSACNLPK